MHNSNWRINLTNDIINDVDIYDKLMSYFNLDLYCSYILKTEKNQFCILEKFLYDIMQFHCKRLNYNINENYIEFWFNRFHNNNNIHIDGDDYLRNINKIDSENKPLLTCLIYMTDSRIPTIITNLSKTDYTNNNISLNHKVSLSFPKKFKLICFEGGNYYHGNYNIFNKTKYDRINEKRFVIVVNLWKKKPTFVPFFDNTIVEYMLFCNLQMPIRNNYIEKTSTSILTLQNKIDNIKILCSNGIFDQSFFNKLINYKLYDNVFNNYSDLLQEIDTNLLYYDLFMFDIDEIFKGLIKYSQRFIIKNVYNKIVCNWIINECEKYSNQNNGWTTNRHQNYPTTDLPICRIENINSYIKSTYKTIFNYIKESYCLDGLNIYNICDSFVVKYKHDNQNFLEWHRDASTISINILLNNNLDFTGGGIKFKDNIRMIPNQGDMIIHNSKSIHCGCKIYSGVRYVLVLFINIYPLNHCLI
jgi:hypothetical protein